ncbi:hypothetical protein L362_00922 [Enterobacter sp. MGH 16]|nr:hypothetical protein L362_00922 [Enterobacter sp. MGH 16]
MLSTLKLHLQLLQEGQQHPEAMQFVHPHPHVKQNASFPPSQQIVLELVSDCLSKQVYHQSLQAVSQKDCSVSNMFPPHHLSKLQHLLVTHHLDKTHPVSILLDKTLRLMLKNKLISWLITYCNIIHVNRITCINVYKPYLRCTWKHRRTDACSISCGESAIRRAA